MPSKILLLCVTVLLFCAPLEAATRLIFPRVVYQSGRFTGVAIANPTNSSAEITLTAYATSGALYQAPGVTNPRRETIPAGQQYSAVGSQLFPGIPEEPTPIRLWVDITSPVDGLTGFFLDIDDIDNRPAWMDGGDLSGSGTDLVLPLVENIGSNRTEISIVNPGVETVSAVVEFLSQEGEVVLSLPKTLERRAMLSGPLADFFVGVDWTRVASIRIRSDRTIVCYGFIFRSTGNTLVALAAQNSLLPAKTLYFPQLAEGGDDGWSTSIGLVNLTDFPALVNITALEAGGTLFGPPFVSNPASAILAPRGTYRAKVSQLFGVPAGGSGFGWLKAEAQAAAISGYIEYGTATTSALVAAQLEPMTRFIFSHQAMTPGWFTGLAVLNSSTLSTNVEVASLTAKGAVNGSTQQFLKPGQRISQNVNEWIPGVLGIAGGAIFIKSDRPVIATQLFGTSELSALANVAPQKVTTSFDPTEQRPRVVIFPLVAVVETGKTLKFAATGPGALTWKVGEIAGGDNTIGTVSPTGLYAAPAKAPPQRTVTVSAEGGELAAGASVDVVQRETLVSGLTLLTAVAYMQNLQRFFVAEQQLLSSVRTSDAPRATTATARISEQLPQGNRVLLRALPNETLSKMIPYVDQAGTSYLIAAGSEGGKIYRVRLTDGQPTTVEDGLSRPTSLALVAGTGDLLVAEAGAGRITVIPRSQFDPTAGAAAVSHPVPKPTYRSVAIGAAPRGIAVDECSGAVYVTTDNGSLIEIQGGPPRTLRTGLNQPGQLLVLYREGLRCSDGTTLLIAEPDRVLQYTPRTDDLQVFISAATATQDLVFFPKGNPFVVGEESAVGVGQGPVGAGASQVSAVPVGTLYSQQPSTPPSPVGTFGGKLPFSDPLGDTFAVNLTLAVPDILSIDANEIGDLAVVTIVFAQPLAPASANAANSLYGFIDFDTAPGGITSHAASHQLFSSEFGTDAYIDLAESKFKIVNPPQEFPVKLDFLGEKLTISFSTDEIDIAYTGVLQIVAVVGNRFQMTDVAPNSGSIQYAPPSIGFKPATSVAFVIPELPLAEYFEQLPNNQWTLPFVWLFDNDGELGISTQPVTVRLTVTGGTATRGVDYLLDDVTITIEPGLPYGSFTLTILNDAIKEDMETIVITLSSPTGLPLGAVTQLTIQILDDDG